MREASRKALKPTPAQNRDTDKDCSIKREKVEDSSVLKTIQDTDPMEEVHTKWIF